jgi:antibiotic biosynthesis monooxygenase (ABM) superfamily enzyme
LNPNIDTEGSFSEITDVVASEIKPAHERDFDSWLKRFLDHQKQASGYLGTTILVPPGNNSNIRIVITRFKNRGSLDAWKKNEERLRMLEEVKGYGTPYYDHATGQETWFSVPGMTISAPPRWKMCVVTFLPAYVISALAFTLLRPIIDSIPFLLVNVIINFILVVGLTYVAMPPLAKLLRRWLYRPL